MFEHRKLVHLSRTLWQNYRAYNICKSINWSYWFCRFQMCLTLLCICYGSRVINVFARSLTFKIHPKVERGKSWNFERTLCQNNKAYNSCTNINRSHLLCRFQICLTLYCSFYGSRVINVFAKSLEFKIHLKVERGESSNFERTLCQNYRAYNSCMNINRSHLLCRFQICLTLYCSYYGSRVINVFAKSLAFRRTGWSPIKVLVNLQKPIIDGATCDVEKWP